MPRKPKPTSRKLLDNTRRSRVNLNEPKNSKPKTLEPPAYLHPIARAEWKRIVAECDPGLIQSTDLIGLEVLCTAYSIFRRAVAEANKPDGLIRELDTGYAQASEWVGIATKQAAFLQKMLAEFGFTPSSRSRVEIKRESSDLQTWLDAQPASNVVNLKHGR